MIEYLIRALCYIGGYTIGCLLFYWIYCKINKL